jgi:phosphatidylglycerophosphate synthase
MSLIDAIRQHIRAMIRVIARWLNRITNGRIHPDAVTIFGFLMHIPIALLIAARYHYMLAGVLLLVFGLFDALDGELARQQRRESDRGGLLDSSTDRMKEVLLYSGAAYALALGSHPATAAWAVGACGASICVSYVKAKGETIVSSLSAKNMSYGKLNHIFKDGFLTFELRMCMLIAGLVFNQLVFAVAAVAVLASYTALQRLIHVSKAINNVQN